MEVEKISPMGSSGKDDDDVPLPGFRFHPTDEELVGFYLRRKVEKRPISVEIIKQVDIYKYEPWDLPSCIFNFSSWVSQEVWTLCRILKRSESNRKRVPDWRELSAKRNPIDANSKTCSSVESTRHENYISFRGPEIRRINEKKQYVDRVSEANQMLNISHLVSPSFEAPSIASSSFLGAGVNEHFKYGVGDWDELRPVVQFAFDPFLL
ncbi:hypothetical protein U1Q18_023876 [Sarracenia purpurea var. burkii]